MLKRCNVIAELVAQRRSCRRRLSVRQSPKNFALRKHPLDGVALLLAGLGRAPAAVFVVGLRFRLSGLAPARQHARRFPIFEHVRHASRFAYDHARRTV
jgi:hypothetical protein